MTGLDCSKIRNFCIVAHIDHGKSTLADRMLESTGTIPKRQMKDQLLDDMELERSRGITIKARAVRMHYDRDGVRYELNLIDTPGHVDFQYEVSRSLVCCEGALLLVDAFQGVEAQTVANAFLALEHELKIVPAINKIDLKNARVDEVSEEIEQSLGIDPAELMLVSAKSGIGITEVLDAIIDRVPAPNGDVNAPLQAMVFDSHYDEYRGAITYVRLINGTVKRGEKVKFLRADKAYEVVELGQFVPQQEACDQLQAGQVGYLICNIKSLEDVLIGDTVTTAASKDVTPLPGYQEPRRMVYCGLYPSDGQDFKELREALNRLALNDPSFEFEPETSDALGFGFRCGFLGLLHMEIVQERLEREGGAEIVQTAPTVNYQIDMTDGTTIDIHNPADLPDPSQIKNIREPIVKVEIICPDESIGDLMRLCEGRRGIFKGQRFISTIRLR